MRQRGLSGNDLELLLLLGVEVPDGYLATRKACVEVTRRLKRIIDMIDRLHGKRAVVAGDVLVTAYHCSNAQRRRLVARAEEQGGAQ
jgi:hypothetical protein